MHDLFSSPVCQHAVRLGDQVNRPYRSLLWGDGRTRRRRLRERLRNDRLLAIFDVCPYLLHRSLPLGGNYIISRRDIQANRGVSNRGVTAHQLPGVGIDLHRATPEHQHAIILNDIPFAVDDENALRRTQRRTNNWELVTRRGRIQGGVGTNRQEQQRADESPPHQLLGAKTGCSLHKIVPFSPPEYSGSPYRQAVTREGVKKDCTKVSCPI